LQSLGTAEASTAGSAAGVAASGFAPAVDASFVGLRLAVSLGASGAGEEPQPNAKASDTTLAAAVRVAARARDEGAGLVA